MADYKEGDVTWQGFLRPYRDAKEAKAVFEKYVAGVKKDGAEVKTLTTEGADEMVVSSTSAWSTSSSARGTPWPAPTAPPSLKPAEAFARALAKTLPAKIRALSSGK